MSAESKRRCYKCGRSPAEDPSIKLFRFPNPGKTNALRCELWAKYVFPDKEYWSQQFQCKLYTEHRMLCNRHFPKTSFSDFPLGSQKLHRFAVPENEPQPSSSYNASMDVPNKPETLCIHDSSMSKRILLKENEPRPSSSYNASVDVPNKPKTLGIHDSSMTNRIPLKENEPQPSSSYSAFMDVPNKPEILGTHNSLMSEIIPLKETSSSSFSVLKDVTNKQEMPQKVALDFHEPMLDTNETSTTKVTLPKEKTLYAKCRRHLKKIYQMKKQIEKLKNKKYLEHLENNYSVNVLMKKLTPSFALLLQSQIKNFNKKSKGRRWNNEEKIIALRIYKRSPTCYRLMRRLFCLPAETTLKTLLGRFSLEVGINKPIFSVLNKLSKQRQPSDNEHVIMFDEMSIRKNLTYNVKKDVIEGFQDHGHQGRSPEEATHALVFMLAGIRKRTKQPVAYYLSGEHVTADRLAVLIKQVIHECLQAGISIAATVCDLDGVNRRAMAILGATMDKPFFTIENKEIVSLYDTPHLLKCFRNLFMKYDIKCTPSVTSDEKSGLGVAKWSHIQTYYDLDRQNPNFVFSPALRKEHLNPNNRQKMKVKLAAQVLSHTVAAGMFAKISGGQLTSEATATADVVEKIDRLFDSLNSDNADLRRGKPYATNIKENSPHKKLYNDMKEFFKNINFINCKCKPPSQDGWIWTLNGTELLWDSLIKKHKNIKSLATRRLQQDPLENLFGCIRGNCGSNNNPTAVQFVSALKTAIMTNLAHQSTGNCENDLGHAIINNYKELLMSTEPVAPATGSSQFEDSNVSSSSDISEELETMFTDEIESASGETQACAYVCGFLIKKVTNMCSTCDLIFNSTDMIPEHIFISFKEYFNEKQLLKYPNMAFIKFVESCALVANAILRGMAHESYILKKVMCEIRKKVNFDFFKVCPVHWEENFKNIVKNISIIVIKRYCTLKNQQYAEEASKASLKKKIAILKHA